MAKFILIVKDVTVYHKEIEVPDDRDPYDYADEVYASSLDSFTIKDGTYTLELIPKESTDAKAQSN